jgi:predicted DNA-binding protein
VIGTGESMSNHKLNTRYNVVSLRVTDEEKAALDEVRRRTNKNLSTVVREAIQLYSQDASHSGCRQE